MNRPSTLTWLIGSILISAPVCPANAGTDVVARGKAATALVEVAGPEGGSTGSAFCIDKIGVFVTNAHVVEEAMAAEGRVRVVVDIGLPTQKVLKAKILRVDHDVDLALLKVDTVAGLSPLDLGKDADLALTEEITTFGFPFGKLMAVARDAFPDITVNRSRITSLKQDKGRLKVVQFDGQINPGNSGGPVLDADGRVIGVAWATVKGAGINFAIPVGLLADFLAAPGVVFDPPPLAYEERSRSVTWTIKVQPPMPGGKLPDDLSVAVTIANSGDEEPRTVVAKSLGNGEFRATLVPVPHDPERKVAVDANFAGRMVHLEIKDGEIAVGGRKFLASDFRQLNGRPNPMAFTVRGPMVMGPITGLPKVKTRINDRPTTIDLSQANNITIRPLDPPSPVRFIEARVEAKRMGKVLAAVVKRLEFPGVPGVATRPGTVPASVPVDNSPRDMIDRGKLKIGDVLNVVDAPQGAGGSIRPPAASIGSVQQATPATSTGWERSVPTMTDVCSVAIAPDGSLVATRSSDGFIRLYEATTGRVVRSIEQKRGPGSLAFLPGGKQLFSTGPGDGFLILEVATGGELLEVQGGSNPPIISGKLSTNGQLVLTLHRDATLLLREAATGRKLGPIDGTVAGKNYDFTPDGKQIVMVSPTSPGVNALRLWDIASGKELWRSAPLTGGESKGCWALPDGPEIVRFAGDGSVTWFGMARGIETRRLALGVPVRDQSVALSPDGRKLITGHNDQTVRIWDLISGREERRFLLPAIAAGEVAFSPDGRFAVGNSYQKSTHLWSLAEPAVAAALPLAPLVRPFAGTISDVTVGGGGRYLLLMIKDARKIAVFDANTADIVKSIPLASENALIAAGAHKFVIAYPDEKLLQRWDLETMTRDGGPVASPINAGLRSLSLGCDSDGPVLAAWLSEAFINRVEHLRFSFIDLESLKVLKVGSINVNLGLGVGSISDSGGSFDLHPFQASNLHIRASAGGGVYGFWSTRTSPSGFQTLQVHGKVLSAVYDHRDAGHLVPGPDGQTIYTGRGGRTDVRGNPIGTPEGRDWEVSNIYIPSSDPTYYLALAGLSSAQRRPGVSPDVPSSISASVHLTGDGSRLLSFRGLEEMANSSGEETIARHDFTVDKRFHLIPASKLFVTIPKSNDRLIIRRLDIEETLSRLSKDYLFVSSPTCLFVSLGQAFEHQIVVRSSKGGVSFSLADGPQGFRVSPEGKITYTPPSRGEEVKAVITVSDASGQERFHKITLRVR